MRKITTLLCAVAIAISASAASFPVAPNRTKNIRSNDKVQTVMAQRHKHNMLEKAAILPRKADVKAVRAPQMNAEQQDVIITSCSAIYYPEDGQINYYLTPADWSPSFTFYINIPEGKHDVESGQTYTLSDMDADYCYWTDDDWEDHALTEASFTKTKGENYSVVVDGTVKDDDGNEFHFRYEEQPLTLTGETIKVALEPQLPDYQYISDGTWMLRARNEQYFVQLNYYCANTASVAGTFVDDNIELSNTFIYVYTGELDEYDEPEYNTVKVKGGTITIDESETTISVEANLIGSDGNVYAVTLSYNLPHAETQESIESSNLTIVTDNYEIWSEVLMGAKDENNAVYLKIYPLGLNADMAGTYTIGVGGTEAYIRPGDDVDNEVAVFSGSFDITYDEGSYTLTGKLLAINNVEYTLDLKYIKPVKSREQTLTFENLILAYSDYAFEVYGFNNDSTQAIDLVFEYENEISGGYNLDNILTNFSFVMTDIVAETAENKSFVILEAALEVAYSAVDSTAVITGTLLGRNVSDNTDLPEFTVNLTAKVLPPYAKDETVDFEYQFAMYALNTDNVESGLVYVTAVDGTAAANIEVRLPENATTLTIGEYPVSAEDTPMTISASKGMDAAGALYTSLVGLVNESNQYINVWYITDGKMIVAEDGVIELQCTNSNGKKVNAILGSSASALRNANVDSAVVKRIENGVLIIEKNGVKYNAQGQLMK